MLMQQTLSQLRNLKLDGMARAFEEQAALTATAWSSNANWLGATRAVLNA